MMNMSKTVKRLYSQFKPENYKLEITINPDEMTFSGVVEIIGKKTGRPSKRLTFHQNGLKITKASMLKRDKNGVQTLEISRINNHKSLHEVRLHCETMLYPGQYTVSLEFEAPIKDDMNGLYPSYFEHKGKTKKLFATHLESHHAREVFPCIDEPIAKATFDLSIIAPKGPVVLSNMPESSVEELKGSLQKTTFRTSPIMSSYLLAFTYGEVHSIEAKTKSGVLVRTWATIAQPKANLKYALKEAVDILEFYEAYFKTPFPLEKCDHIALPDFDAGAMENWGLITYREVCLLTDPVNRSVPSEQYVSLVISHEVSHQWFGNLVTMAWWDDLWLNESFAAVMEHVALDALHKDWHQWEQYAAYDIISSSNRDVFSDVQHVGIGVSHPDEISSLFDTAIVYCKGGRLIKMLREFIGDETFRLALQNYFKKHAYKNTVRGDLWQAMSDASGKDIASLMTPWITQSGMPLVTVDTTPAKDVKSVNQTRFIFDKQNDTQLWPIPLLANIETGPSVFDTKDVLVKLSTTDKPLLVNKNGSGHLVVRYKDPEDYEQLITLMKSQQIPSEARINVLNDHLLLARRGDISLVDVLKIISEMKDEPRDAVWNMVARAIGYAMGIGEHTAFIEDSLRELRFKLASQNYKNLGWKDNPSDDPNTTMLRSTMIGLMLSAKDQNTINFVLDYHHKTAIDQIPSDRRPPVFATVVKYNNSEAEIQKLIDLYKSSQNPDLLQSISAGLCSTENPVLAKKLFDEGLSENGFVKPQDYFRWYAYLSSNKYTRDVAWEWLVGSWDKLIEKFRESIGLDYFITFSARPIHTTAHQQRFNAFFEPKTNIILVTRAIKVAQAEIEARVVWRNRDLEKLENYFKALQ